MKAKITLIVENNKPVSVLGENPEYKIRYACDLTLRTLLDIDGPANEESFTIEDVQILDEDK